MLNDFTPEVFQFVRDHENDDERELVLKHKTILGVPASFIAEQISARRKAKLRLPLWYETSGIVFPPQLNMEQSSSEATGRFKQRLLKKHLSSFENGIDLTGGFGVDSFFLSKVFRNFSYNDPNQSLREIAEHNFALLGAENVEYYNDAAENLLARINVEHDLIFVDPSRRVSQKKVFTLADSEPNIVALQDDVLIRTRHLLVKASPLLDIKLGVSELKNVTNVYVVAVDNEVKELLFLAKRNFIGEPLITAVNLKRESEELFSFRYSEESELSIEHGDPHAFLYEPNAAILKSGAFKTIAQKFNLKKLHPNTHLYTNSNLIDGFPGRIFRAEALLNADTKSVRSFFPGNKANIITRNYPLGADELKRKYKLNDGGEKYLLAFSGQKKKFLFAATRVK